MQKKGTKLESLYATDVTRLTSQERHLMRLLLKHVTHLMKTGTQTVEIQRVTSDMNKLAYCVSDRFDMPLNRGAYIGIDELTNPDEWIKNAVETYEKMEDDRTKV